MEFRISIDEKEPVSLLPTSQVLRPVSLLDANSVYHTHADLDRFHELRTGWSLIGGRGLPSLEHFGKLADAFKCCPIVLSKARPCFASAADESSRLCNRVVCRLRIRRLRFDRCHLNRTVTSEVRRHAHCAGSIDRCGRCHDNRRRQHAARMQLECVLRSELDYGTDTRVRARRG